MSRTRDEDEEYELGSRINSMARVYDDILTLARFPSRSDIPAGNVSTRLQLLWNIISPSSVPSTCLPRAEAELPTLSESAQPGTSRALAPPPPPAPSTPERTPAADLAPVSPSGSPKQHASVKKQSAWNFCTTKDQLAAIGRTLARVVGDGNCLFHSVVHHLGTRNMTADRLRQLACAEARSNPEQYEVFMDNVSRAEFLRQVNILSSGGTWDLAIGDLSLLLVQVVLNRRILVLRNNNRPHMIPEDGQDIADDTIVLVQNDFQTHFDATELLYWPDGERAYGLAAQQVALYGREIDPVPSDGNSLFESINKQLEVGQHSAETLRDLAFHRGREYTSTYAYLYDLFGARRYQDALQIIKECGRYLSSDAEIIAMEILTDQLGAKVMLVTEGRAPIHIPNDGMHATQSTIIVVKDHNSASHFDATKPKHASTGVIGYGTVREQLDEIGREVMTQLDSHNSLFQSISCQKMQRPMTALQLKDYISNANISVLTKYYKYYPPSKSVQQLGAEFRDLNRNIWNNDIRDVVLHILHERLRLRFVIVHDQSKPQHIPDDGTPVNDSTIVLVETQSAAHGRRFHGSKFKQRGRGPRPYTRYY